jgi:CRISPR/Cas system-associated exonuclease Cas4 (RecB family)
MNSLYQIRNPASGACPPDYYSHSGLTQIENCPRRWWLLHSRYDTLAGRYPEPLSSGAMIGSIVHAALERFSVECSRSGLSEGTRGLKEFRRQFPIRETVREKRRQFLEEASANPRAQVALLETNVSVDRCISLFKDLVRRSYGVPILESTITAQNEQREKEAPAGPRKAEAKSYGTGRDVPCPAVLPEVELRLDDPPVRGKIDLVVTARDGDTLIEYKTGEPRPEHESQSRLYAFLWWSCTGRLARERQLLYPTQDVVRLGRMSRTELEQEGTSLKARVARAKKELESSLPSALIEAERCRSCSVRHLCAEYWTARETSLSRWTQEARVPSTLLTSTLEWRDLEIQLVDAQRLAEGFIARGGPDRATRQVVCKLPAKFRSSAMDSHEKVRLLSVGLMPDGEGTRVAWSAASEAFWR